MFLYKNVGARVKCSQYCCCCDSSKVKTQKEGDAQPVILKKGIPRQRKKSGSKANLSVVSVTFVVSS